MANKTLLTRLIHEELEPRLLFSGGLETVLIDDNLPGSETAIVETVSESETEILQLEQNQQANSESEPASEVVFIDENVENYDQLMADLANKDNIDVYILDSSVDGIEQISAVLANYDGLDAIHIVSHGNEASLSLGNGNLDSSNIESYSKDITGWQAALNADADLLIYGCDVASNPEGQALIANLQSLTGTDVAASDDTTGQASLGGDWDLEYQAGNIETSVVFSTQVQSNWVGTLPAPTINNLAGDTLAYSEGDGAQTIEQGTDVSTSLSGGGSPSYSSLTISIAAGGDVTEDVLSILNQGSGNNQIGFDGTNVSYEGTNIGTVSGGSSGNDLQIIFNSNANNDGVADLIENITYENTDTDNPTTSARTIDFTLTQSGGGGGGGDSTTNSTTVDVTAVNDAPTAAANTVTTNEDTAYAFGAADFNFTDVDGDGLASIKITTLESAGTLQLNGVDVALNDVISKADIDAGKLSFAPGADANGAGYDHFEFSVNDGTVDSVTSYAMSMDVTALNDAPVAAVSNVTTTEDTAYTFSASDFNFTDVDGDSLASIKITSLESAGTLQLSGVNVTLNDVISKADIDAGKLQFVPAADANGAGYDSFDFSVNDGTADSAASYAMTMDVTATNDAPVNSVPGDQFTPEDSTLIFSTANGNAININDVDANGGLIEVKLAVGKGTLTLSNTTGLTFQQGDGVDDRAVTFSGTVDDINAALEGLAYTTDAHANGSAQLTIVTHDNGNTGSGGIKTDTDNVTINIAEVNNTPTNSIPGEQTISAADTLTFSGANGNGISISDIDDNGSAVKVSLSVDNGSLSLNGVSGLSFLSGDGTDDSVLVFAGTVTDINAALEGLSYSPDGAFAGPAVMTIVTDDQGNTGTGGAKTDTDSVAINITAANHLTVDNNEPVAQADGAAVNNAVGDTVAPVAQDETITPLEPDAATETNSQETSDIVINVDADGKPTVRLNQGGGASLQSLVNNTNPNADNITAFSLENMAREENITINSVSPWNLDSQLTGNELQMALDELNQQLGSDGRAEQDGDQIIVSTLAGVSIALTAGFVTWALQGGSLLTALMTVLPVWNTFDPLPVLNANNSNKNTAGKNQHDEIDAVFDKTAPVTQN